MGQTRSPYIEHVSWRDNSYMLATAVHCCPVHLSVQSRLRCPPPAHLWPVYTSAPAHTTPPRTCSAHPRLHSHTTTPATEALFPCRQHFTHSHPRSACAHLRRAAAPWLSLTIDPLWSQRVATELDYCPLQSHCCPPSAPRVAERRVAPCLT